MSSSSKIVVSSQGQHRQRRNDGQLQHGPQVEGRQPHVLDYLEAIAEVRERLDVGAADRGSPAALRRAATCGRIRPYSAWRASRIHEGRVAWQPRAWGRIRAGPEHERQDDENQTDQVHLEPRAAARPGKRSGPRSSRRASRPGRATRARMRGLPRRGNRGRRSGPDASASSRRSMRDICHRKRAQMNSRKYQRRSRNCRAAAGSRIQTTTRPARGTTSRPRESPYRSSRRARPESARRDPRRPRRRTRAGAAPRSSSCAISSPKRRLLEFSPRAGSGTGCGYELPHNQAHALVNDRFREDQERQGYEHAQVNVHVVEERHGDAIAPGEALCDGQQKQRQPGEQSSSTMTRRLGNCSASPARPRAPPELVQRPAEDQREVRWFLHGGPGASGSGETRTRRCRRVAVPNTSSPWNR